MASRIAGWQRVQAPRMAAEDRLRPRALRPPRRVPQLDPPRLVPAAAPGRQCPAVRGDGDREDDPSMTVSERAASARKAPRPFPTSFTVPSKATEARALLPGKERQGMGQQASVAHEDLAALRPAAARPTKAGRCCRDRATATVWPSGAGSRDTAPSAIVPRQVSFSFPVSHVPKPDQARGLAAPPAWHPARERLLPSGENAEVGCSRFAPGLALRARVARSFPVAASTSRTRPLNALTASVLPSGAKATAIIAAAGSR